MADPLRTEQVESMLDDGWLEAAPFFSYASQCDTLGLCAEIAPCQIDDPDATLAGPNDDAWCWGAHEGARLLRQMPALGVSKYHPDPLKAIEHAKR